MTIKTSLTAFIAVFSVMLIFAPTTHATEKPDTKTPVTVTVQVGDTLTSIADAKSTTYVRLFNANDFISNPDVIDVGQVVRIPTPDEQLPDRYASISTSQPTSPTYSASSQPVHAISPANRPAHTNYSASSGNTYYYGYCTWYAKQRRPDLPNMLGNGGQWTANAAARGLATGVAPRASAIAETSGHVAYVESVNGNGTITISEMNGPAGFGVIGTRTVPANQYHYIY